MLKKRRFNIVLVSRENTRPLNLENPEGKMVEYNGRQVEVTL
jgi:alpha-D-xyloside xylohydrolase